MEENSDFILPAIDDRNLSPKEAANEIASHFVSISNSIEPLDIPKLPPNVRTVLEDESKGKCT